MRRITSFALHALAATALIAFAASSAAAADAYLKLGTIKGESAAKSSAGAKIDVSSWSWGAAPDAGARKGWDGTVKGRPPSEAAAAVPAETSGGDAAMPAEKRQHGWVTVSKPLERGSLMVMGSLPGCTVGAAYADAELETALARYIFQDIMITSCAAPGEGSGSDRPSESITLSYASMRESPTRASQK